MNEFLFNNLIDPLVVFEVVEGFFFYKPIFQLDYGLCLNRQREDIGRRDELLVKTISLSLGIKKKYQYRVKGNLYRNL